MIKESFLGPKQDKGELLEKSQGEEESHDFEIEVVLNTLTTEFS